MQISGTPPQVHARDLPLLRAAYSDRTASLMSTLARLAYDFPPDGSAPGPAPVIPSEFAALGFDRITYFHNGLHNGWAYIVEGAHIIAVVFRGTKSIQDWETDFNIGMVNPLNTDPKLRVHRGFYQAFCALSDGQRGLREKIDELKATQETIPIYFSGHSLGGALAQIATAAFGSDQIAACYTFGSPRVGNSFFDLWVKPPSYRVDNYADIVPQVPVFAPQAPLPALYRDSGDPRYLPDHGAGSPYRYQPGVVTRARQLVKGLIHWVRAGAILGIVDHAITEYERKLAAIAAGRSQGR
jgi:triacylglycerol lipase